MNNKNINLIPGKKYKYTLKGAVLNKIVVDMIVEIVEIIEDNSFKYKICEIIEDNMENSRFKKCFEENSTMDGNIDYISEIKNEGESYIRSAYYSFKYDMLVYETPRLIIKETEKTYVTETGRYLKKDESRAIDKTLSNFPEITVFMVDAPQKALKNEIIKWFEEKAKRINECF